MLVVVATLVVVVVVVPDDELPPPLPHAAIAMLKTNGIKRDKLRLKWVVMGSKRELRGWYGSWRTRVNVQL